MGGAMKPIDQKKQARSSSASDCSSTKLRQRLTSGTEELWKRVDTKLNGV